MKMYSYRVDEIVYTPQKTVKMPQCLANCKTGARCSFQAKTGFTMCGKHIPPPDVIVSRCSAVTRGGVQCPHPCFAGTDMCLKHEMSQRRQEETIAEEAFGNVVNILWTTRDIELAREEILNAIADGSIHARLVDVMMNEFDEEIELFTEIFPPLPPNLMGELHALSVDAQNVHTTAVNKQTEAGLACLLNTPVPSRQRTILEIQTAWNRVGYSNSRRVLKDVEKWYMTKTCRSSNDFLYRNALDGLWCRISDSEHRDELISRLWEECFESMKLCCDGHLSRLSNVLVGFDDVFVPIVSSGERLQQGMSAIASEDSDLYSKVERAWNLFEELNVPFEDRLPWIDAL